MIPPALDQVAHDERCRGAPLAVYVHLLPLLALHDYRPVKAAAVARALRMKDVTAWRALDRLVDSGYLLRGHTEDRIPTYRLVWSVRNREKAGFLSSPAPNASDRGA